MSDTTPTQGDPAVTDFMVRDVPALAPADRIATAARVLVDSGLPGLPVLDGTTLVGILTESDLISQEAEVETPSSLGILDALFAPDVGRHFDDEMRQVLATTVDGLMSRTVTTVLPEATLTQVATVMTDRHISVVPVVSGGGQLLGLVTRRAIVRRVAELDASDR